MSTMKQDNVTKLEKREMLRLAGLAYGLDCGAPDSLVGEYIWDRNLLSWWSSLHYDVDCARLALELKLNIIHDTNQVEIKSNFYTLPSVVEHFENEGERGPAMRLAVTRAAAIVSSQIKPADNT